MSGVTDNAWVEISDPMMSEARRRKAIYEQWVAQYDSANWWGRLNLGVYVVYTPTEKRI